MNGHAAEQVVALSRSIRAPKDPRTVLHRLVTTLVHELGGVSRAGVTSLAGESGPAARTDAVVTRVQAFERMVREGPSLSAATRDEVVRSDDLADEPRWPEFAPRAVTAGIRSVVAIPVPLPDGAGAVALYGTAPGAIGRDATPFASSLTARAAMAVAAREQENLRAALATRDVIGQAKGILMERHHIGADQAFAELQRTSQATNTKLRLVAEELAETGALPSALGTERG